jgi:Arc/MetJ-type ribon-helix-helix transcriptional regulator
MSDWKSPRIQGILFEQIQEAVDSIKVRNMRKYDSVSDFVQKACIMLLDKEKVEVRT